MITQEFIGLTFWMRIFIILYFIYILIGKSQYKFIKKLSAKLEK